MIQATHEQLVAAFEAWEVDYRANPDKFYTPEEVAVFEIATLSEGRAIAFAAYLRQTQSV